MINLSKLALRSSDFTLSEKYQILCSPDVFYAGNVLDLALHRWLRPDIDWLKKLLFRNTSSVYIVLHKVSCSRTPSTKRKDDAPHYFYLRDYSYEMSVLWPESNIHETPYRPSFAVMNLEEGEVVDVILKQDISYDYTPKPMVYSVKKSEKGHKTRWVEKAFMLKLLNYKPWEGAST